MQREILQRIRKDRTKPKARTGEEERLIRQAKEMLMQKKGYDEEEAHRYLQKQSMDSGNTLTDTAWAVINMF